MRLVISMWWSRTSIERGKSIPRQQSSTTRGGTRIIDTWGFISPNLCILIIRIQSVCSVFLLRDIAAHALSSFLDTQANMYWWCSGVCQRDSPCCCFRFLYVYCGQTWNCRAFAFGFCMCTLYMQNIVKHCLQQRAMYNAHLTGTRKTEDSWEREG